MLKQDVVLNLDYNMYLMEGHKNEKALKVMELAIVANKKNPLPMYQKANIPLSIEELKENFPHESSVYALIGMIYKRRNMYDKAAIEKLHVPDETMGHEL
ncbi:hypothetical protein R3W88_031805 [Solanum pinnatisectum]|uniref:Uncharacterized protein n=1 Tax=Solanum pinnatisectum TaxID=50273 RepID=A0AAV9LN07_9SOLN|nr:hypothetical protein R3W88_031805 [Solanum pinnatisectum]